VSPAVPLSKGVAGGGGFGFLGAVGLPSSVGAVLPPGLAYVGAPRTRHNISTYVALIGGLSLFERLSNLEAVETWPIVREIATAILVSGGGTLLGERESVV